jgi:3-methyladenine DNA glycosylase/8-oxoguanine DNA glycosylase
METVYRPRLPLELGPTLSVHAHGPYDPTVRVDGRGAWWRATRTPSGPATTRIALLASGSVRIEAWGAGAEWAVAAAPELLGDRDSLEGFEPKGKLAELCRRFEGMRIGRSRAVFESAVATAFEQLVTSVEAHVSWGRVVRAWCERAPGPMPLLLPPAPETLAHRTSFEMRAHGVDAKRARGIRGITRYARRLDEIVDMPLDAARARLLAVPGIGPWTAGRVAMAALGDADAIALGDYHLPHIVTYAFTGDARGDEARMLALLAPYAGHRGRVVRLLMSAGISAPKFGPHRALRRFRSPSHH